MPASEPVAVLHVVASFTATDGGSARSIAELAAGQVAAGADVTLLTMRPSQGELMPPPPGVRLTALPDENGAVVRPSAASRAIAAWSSRFPHGVVHLHGLWRLVLHHAVRTASARGVPVVWAPMGMLEPWALRRRRWTKRLAWWSYQRTDLGRARVLHATSPLEAAGIRAARVRGPVAVVPLGVNLPSPSPRLPGGDVRTALFLSRIHPKKGVLDLVSAWADLAPRGWRLRIVGPDEGGHAAEVAALIRTRQAAGVSLEGPLWGEAKAAAFADCDLFVLPSYSENFGLVIAEALAAGRPVLTTRATPWSELEREGCGWWVEPGRATLVPALRTALSCPRSELAMMGARGRRLVARRYAWPAVAASIIELYRWARRPAEPAPASVLPP